MVLMPQNLPPQFTRCGRKLLFPTEDAKAGCHESKTQFRIVSSSSLTDYPRRRRGQNALVGPGSGVARRWEGEKSVMKTPPNKLHVGDRIELPTGTDEIFSVEKGDWVNGSFFPLNEATRGRFTGSLRLFIYYVKFKSSAPRVLWP